jgi:hypothetical protein
MQSSVKSLPKGIPEVPLSVDPVLRPLLVAMREELLNARRLRAPLGSPSNFSVTPQDRANLLQFTRPLNADYFEVLWSPTSSFAAAQVLGTSTANIYTDFIGQAAIKRFYWVRARNYQGAEGPPTGPIAGTTLAVGSTVNPPTPPPIGQQQHQNQGSGQREYQ